MNYKVLVRCMTYNHAPYILDAMKGFCMQQTSFPYICAIVDDASTDGEQNIILDFVKHNFLFGDMEDSWKNETEDFSQFLVRHKSNYNCYFSITLLKYNHYSIKKDKILYIKKWIDSVEYLAMCEGDDYWTDPQKLQKEYNYLTDHPEKGLVYTNCNVLLQDEGVVHKDVFSSGYFKKTNNYKDFLIEGNYIAPCSWLYRKDELSNIEVPPFVTDWTLFIAFSLLLKDRVGYIVDTTCTYRVSHGSASHNSDMVKRYNYLKGAFATECFFINSSESLFTSVDKDLLFERRYKCLMPFAVAFYDKQLLNDIKSFHFKNLSWKNRLMLFLSFLSPVRKYVYRRKSKSIQKEM